MFAERAGIAATRAVRAAQPVRRVRTPTDRIKRAVFSGTIIQYSLRRHPDVVYRTENEKFDAVVQEIEERNQKGQPILVGTTSVAKSERLARMLKKKGIKHNVLNAALSKDKMNKYDSANWSCHIWLRKALPFTTHIHSASGSILFNGSYIQ